MRQPGLTVEPAAIMQQSNGDPIASIQLRTGALCALVVALFIAVLAVAAVSTTWILIGSAVAVVAMGIVFAVISRTFIQPLKVLAAKTDLVASGESLQIIDIPSGSTLAPVAANFNTVTRKIKENAATINELKQVGNRTRELQDQADELAELYSNTIALSEIGQQITSSSAWKKLSTRPTRTSTPMMDAAGSDSASTMTNTRAPLPACRSSGRDRSPNTLSR